MDRLRKRKDFLAAADGARWNARGFLMQARFRAAGPPPAEAAPIDEFSAIRTKDARVGFTVTKRIGNAVVRNRIRRRLRSAAALAAEGTRPGWDYVLIAREPAKSADHATLVAALAEAFQRIHDKAPGRGTTKGRGTAKGRNQRPQGQAGAMTGVATASVSTVPPGTAAVPPGIAKTFGAPLGADEADDG